MNGREFLDSARRLLTGGHASDLRSSVSRAYYAAFHAVFDFFADCGIRFSRHTTEAHTKMAQCLDNCNVAFAAELAAKLRSLRDDRNSADYDMQGPVRICD